MRVIDAEQFIEFRKILDKRLTMFYSVSFGLVMFIFFMFSNLLTGLIVGFIMFIFAYLIIFFIRGRVSKNIENKRQKVEDEGAMLDVEFRGENGYLIITEKTFKFVNLTKFADNKNFEIEINEDLFINVDELKYSAIQKLKYGVLVKGSISIKEMPNGAFYEFVFYDIDGALQKTTGVLDNLNQFNLEKHKK